MEEVLGEIKIYKLIMIRKQEGGQLCIHLPVLVFDYKLYWTRQPQAKLTRPGFDLSSCL